MLRWVCFQLNLNVNLKKYLFESQNLHFLLFIRLAMRKSNCFVNSRRLENCLFFTISSHLAKTTGFFEDR